MAPGLALRTAGALLLAVLASSARAEALRIDAAPCARKIQVEADDVPLGEVVRRIATALNVRLDLKVELLEKVTVRRSGSPESVLKQLLQHRNLVLDSNPVKRCGGRDTLTAVWVLPAGEVAPPRAAQAKIAEPVIQQPGEAQFTPPGRPTPRLPRRNMSEAERKKAQEDWKAGRTEADPVTGMPVPAETGTTDKQAQ